MVTSRRCLALVAAMLLLPVSMRAQTACDYATCALRIVPRLSGLDVVRGDGNERAGSLNFLWPSGTLTRAFVEDANATLAVSVPLQFAADEALSKAVHRFNRRFAR